jgi:AraC-like DNA-binding protein
VHSRFQCAQFVTVRSCAETVLAVSVSYNSTIRNRRPSRVWCRLTVMPPSRRSVPNVALFGSLPLAAFAELFEGLPRVMACAKGADRNYTYANQLFAERAGCRRVSQVIGRTAQDLFAPDLAAAYDAQDDAVLATGRPLQDQLELIGTPGTIPRWHVTSKVRLLSDSAAVVGVLCVSVDVAGHEVHGIDGSGAGVSAVLSEVRQNLGAQHRVGDLAARSGLSLAQFERYVKRAYGLAPRQLMQRFRFEEAMHLLTHTDSAVAEVAVACGFYDQPSFTRQFRDATGFTPAAYRAGHPFKQP